MELETRDFQIREVNDEERTVTGIAVPFDSETNVGGYREKFERGAIAGVEGVKLFWNHQEVIGKVIRGADTDAGYEVTAKFSDTTLGRDAHTLAKDGAVDKFSVGFVPVEHRTDEGVVVRTKVDLKEVSLVPFPAYAGAQISEVRAEANNASANNSKEDSNESTIMENENVYDDSELRSELDIVKRELAVVRENGASTGTAGHSLYRSAGEFLKDYALGVENAETRAYTGAVLADSHTSNDWKNELLRIVDNGRPLVNLFDRGPLGPTGMSVEYPKVSGVSGAVAKQASEGDNLSYLELGVTTATAPINTYGVYSELSRQAIERSNVAYLDAVLRAQAASYSKTTNAVVRDAIEAASAQAGTSFTLSSATAANFTGALVDAARKIDANGVLSRTADIALVSADVFDKMTSLFDSNGRPLFDVNGDGSNTIGNLNIGGLTLSVAGLTVVLDTGLANKSLYVASRNAVQTWENSGAPIRLDDENVVNLTKVYSIYGYLAVGVKDANGLVKATIA